ncbi:hypothetical protein E0500_016540 [Streptomyces sp. KM273126]|uniref:hypothetical protein n=1 Tax=Streptomyces sp. KM273126 TaxID=2545247 RepID=UPI00103FB68C|nr:hypothetical protein [Streptomyces sp. KM273126]MBA2808965.1 hypothetical protein [Streptomyces sp. KM273126]
MTAGRCSRALRAAVFAAVCVLFAVQGHVMTSGVEVPWWALVAGALATGGTVWCLAHRERGLLAVGSVAVATQVVLHSLFALAQAVERPEPGGASLAQRWVRYVLCSPPEADGGSGAATTLAHSMSHEDALGMDASLLDASGSVIPVSGMDGAGGIDMVGPAGHAMGGMSSTGMLTVHLIAALLGGLWLAHGERAAFRILRALAGWLVAPLRLLLRLPAPPHRPRVRARRGYSDRTPRRLLLVHAITSRGPPAGTAVL